MTNSLQFSAVDDRIVVQGPLLEFNLLYSAVLHARTLLERGLGRPSGEPVGDIAELWIALCEVQELLPDVRFEDASSGRCVLLVGWQATLTAVFDVKAWHTLRASIEVLLTHLGDGDLHSRTGAGVNEYRDLYAGVSRVVGMYREARDFLHPNRGAGYPKGGDGR